MAKRKTQLPTPNSQAEDRPDLTAPILSPAQVVRAFALDDIRPITDLVPDAKNRRAHPERNRDMIAASLKAVGAARSIVIAEGNEVLAGNGVLEGAMAAGIQRVRIIEAEGDELIAVRRRGLTPEQKRDLAIFDNRTAELSAWNLDQLREDQAAGLTLAPFFSTAELEQLLKFPPDSAWGAMGGTATVREGFQEMTFTLTDAQVVIVRAALVRARAAGPFDTGNDNSNGNALARICEAYEPPEAE